MIAKEANFLDFLRGQKQFIIPIYQRTYSWTQKQCKQLCDDIMKAGGDDEIPGHFIGSVVYVNKGIYQVCSIPQLLVIDGQQRLTTLSLMLLALSKKLDKEGYEGAISGQKVNNYYLINPEESDQLRHKLLLTQSDSETLIKLVGGRETDGNDSKRLLENYAFITDFLSKEDIDIIYKGLSKLIVIDVSLDYERDNPQLIFESLNSTGLELTQADLVRNYILMGQPPEQQKELYESFWHPMEKNFGYAEYSELFDRFMRDYLTLKTGKIPNIRDVYSAFKSYADTSNYEAVKELVKDIFKYSKYFTNIAFSKDEDPEIKSILEDINALKVDVSYPFILEAYDDLIVGTINREEFIRILKLVESYVFRRAICGIPTNSLNKTFAYLSKDLDKESYIESLEAILTLKDSYRRFPSDNEFQTELLIKDVYNSRSMNYLLRKLENYNRKELVNIENYTIEHIMPQNEMLSEEWKTQLGENWKEIHEKYLHTIGNLTLTGYNPELSDKPFNVKRDMEGGFKDSPIRLNRELANLDSWGEMEILGRGKSISNLASQIWPYPKLDEETLSKYRKVEEVEEKSYSLEDHPHLTGEMLDLFNELRKRILNIDSSVHEEIKKLYIAYKTSTNFVDVVPQKKRLRLSLNMAFDEVIDPRGWCGDVTDKGRWGNGDVEVFLESKEQLDYIMFLINQAYEKVE
jgi:uncharacterized protein with ParB-like and HNH nuclease domain/predicted transport protein